MEYLFKNLAEIDIWIKDAPSPGSFQRNDDFMGFTLELMNYALYLLRVGASLAPNERVANIGFSKQKAIVVGHLVRLAKLYEGLLVHISKHQAELAAIFARLIFETAVRMEYLMKSNKKSFRSFVFISYRAEKEMLEDLSDKAKNRPLIKIEKRMMRKIKSRLKKDEISIGELMNNKNWKLDGKDFRSILKHLGRGLTYSYVFGSASHSIHGDWHEISLHHLEKDGRYYQPKLDYAAPDPRLACPLTQVCLEVLLAYLKWSKCDPDEMISPVVLKLLELNQAVDIAHENMLGT